MVVEGWTIWLAGFRLCHEGSDERNFVIRAFAEDFSLQLPSDVGVPAPSREDALERFRDVLKGTP
jgi:hypothetical protein